METSKTETAVQQLAHFELYITAVDRPTNTRKRWNGEPMASGDANTALREAAEAFRQRLTQLGFEIVRVSYGVAATEATEQTDRPKVQSDPALWKSMYEGR